MSIPVILNVFRHAILRLIHAPSWDFSAIQSAARYTS
jgi:hypothetical protein